MPEQSDRNRMLRACFRMPSIQTIMSRKSSITNAFVTSIIPTVEPTTDEIAQALEILGMSPESIECAYCGSVSSEWDHLRPLVVDRRPTGYISEIGNLVPSCGKCNQSKGNKNWESWIKSKAPHAPARRGVPDLEQRIQRLRQYEKWRPSEQIAFKSIMGRDLFAEYCKRLDMTIDLMRECQEFAAVLRNKIAAAHRSM